MKTFKTVISKKILRNYDNLADSHIGEMHDDLIPYERSINGLGYYAVMTDKQFTFFILKYGHLLKRIEFLQDHNMYKTCELLTSLKASSFGVQ